MALDPSTLPFVRTSSFLSLDRPRVVLVHDIERAFPNVQAGGTRLGEELSTTEDTGDTEIETVVSS